MKLAKQLVLGALVVLVFAFVTIGVLQTPKAINRAVEIGLSTVVEEVMSTVVHIQYEGDKVNRFGKKVGWQGSGVIISKDGLILTARHVCAKPGRFTVTLADDRKFVTEKACVSRDYDVGFLKITDANDFPAAKFGDSAKMRLGSRLLAIGSPWGKRHFNSVTLGIISAVRLKAEHSKDWGWQVLFQTDVAANPGNSGGPIFNTNGEIVGIVVGMYAPTGHYAGITYCVPSNVCKKLVSNAQLIFDLHNVMIVETNERLDKLENQVIEGKEDIRDIEREFDWDTRDIEKRLDDIEFKINRPYDDGVEWQ